MTMDRADKIPDRIIIPVHWIDEGIKKIRIENRLAGVAARMGSIAEARRVPALERALKSN
jgi:hypothetical protein